MPSSSNGLLSYSLAGLDPCRYPDLSASALPAQKQCGLATIKPEHVASAADPRVSLAGTPGLITDLYLYVTMDSGVGKDGRAAGCAEAPFMATTTCAYDANHRPVMSAINVCPDALSKRSPDANVAMLTREILWAMGLRRVGYFSGVYGAAEAPIVMSGGPGASRPVLRTSNVMQVGCQLLLFRGYGQILGEGLGT